MPETLPSTPFQPPRRPWRTRLFGRPLATADAPHQTIGKGLGLAVFASDALSSTAYATQEILLVLAAAGTAAFSYAFPIAGAIVVLLLIVAISYEQTIHAYPDGGGAYIVARDNLGQIAAQVAGAALLSDYILTVSVSVSSGAAQLASAFPALYEYRVPLAVSLVAFVTFVNLRGVKESGTIFAVPTYCFLAMMVFTLAVGFWRYAIGQLGQVVDPPPLETPHELASLSVFLILHAFSNGTTALTGVEAISNGITAFKEPRSHNAGVTLAWMSAVLATLFLGITFLAGRIGAIPSEGETVISQLARTAFDGRGLVYLGVMATTTLILVMAANTAFSGFPRLSAIQAADGFLPRQLTYRGSRLVFSRGIVVLAIASALLIVAFQASVTRLIPLYAIGVFLSFTLSQAGMTLRWRRMGRSLERPPKGWRWKMALNGLGAVLTALVTMVFAVTKFQEGAWVVLLVLPAFVFAFLAIRAHYRVTAEQLSLQHYGAPPQSGRHRVILPISNVHRGTLEALRYARALSHDVTAVHVSLDPAEAERLRAKWDLWGDGVRLVVLDSPYRLLLEPLLDYITSIADERQPNETLTIVVPQFVPRRSWQNVLHAQTALFLRMALLFRRGIVVTNVPYQLTEP
ncbi:MAG TPA: APC family permease [Vicinamibacteria bacterium]|nr:APC family permease [Vicinamibacteria bacterium]